MGHSHTSRPTKVLEGKGLPSIAKYMSSQKCRNVFLMVGAGVSTSAGIPDFRSPETGLYANLARLDLPYPEAVFEIGYFRHNPVPFYTLAHELYPGQFRPTITHSFIRLLHSHSLLHTCFTQNIDTLERRAGIPADKIVEAHGSFASQRCIDCSAPYDDDAMKQKIKDREIAKCETCGGLVKPDIVFFGETLPPRFSRCAPSLREADLLICIGTSLTVHPFASLLDLIPPNCPRLLINLELVGDFGTEVNDVVCLGKCDDIVQRLCKELGWEEELMKEWQQTKDIVEAVDKQEKVKTTKEKLKREEEEKTVSEVESLARSSTLNSVVTSLSAMQLGAKTDSPPSPSTGNHLTRPDSETRSPESPEAFPTKGEHHDEKGEVEELQSSGDGCL